jgi:glutamate/tyrosine decarboxylase-like PLP-dependent enzyme
MDIESLFEKYSTRLNPSLLRFLIKTAKKIPSINRKMEAMKKKEYDRIMAELEPGLKPYRDEFESTSSIPPAGIERAEILKKMKKLYMREVSKWKDGFVSGAVYHGDESHIDFLNKVYALNSQSNPLHSDVWPSTVQYEAEIISMTANMLGAESADSPGDSVCGVVCSGGTEGIMLAMKTYRDRAREEKGIRNPEMVIPVTAHVAFDKAAQYFNIKMRKIPVGSDYRADLKAAEKAVNRNTVVVVGSAPCFPYGVIDPIEELSEIARKKGVGFHCDACLGGFILPWAEKLGYPVPPFDFRLPGVTSISADTHKYGYAPKGTSVILYRNRDLRHYQFFKATDWPGGLYFSPTFAGSRPGALSAGCWSAMVSIGEKGYMDAASRILKTAEKIKKGISGIPGLKIMGDSFFDIAFTSEEIDIYRVMDYMSGKGWSLNGLHMPPAIHICLTLRHTGRGIAERFVRHLKEGVTHVKENPDEKGKMAPVYGMAASIPDRTMVSDLLDVYLDLLYKV